MTEHRFHEAVVIGGSAGSAPVLEEILYQLPLEFPLPILVVQHVSDIDDASREEHFSLKSQLKVIVPSDKQPIQNACVYLAPSNYHMLVERNKTIALSVDEKVNWSRPSIDVLFESAAQAWGAGVIAIILSGANNDGSAGMRTIKSRGGITIAQSPESAEFPVMPQAAIETAHPDYVKRSEEIGSLLIEITAPAA